MKNPWVTLAGICSLVFGIVIFSVIFGGYSSLLRSQNRIHAVKNQLVMQCREQLDFTEAIPQPLAASLTSETSTRLNDAVRQIDGLLSAIESTEDPLDPDLVAAFEAGQVALNQAIAGVAEQFDSEKETSGDSAFRKRSRELELAVFIMSKRYNKEARYFNTRTTVFPGFLIARLFDLDHKKFPEIDVQQLAPSEEKRTASAT
ncbi:MAG: LemA family protein [Desulfobacterales bacterium]|nr:LemA family protein [Desulfobacterales bacterium]